MKYTTNASAAAGDSNIALDTSGPRSVDTFMRDHAANNTISSTGVPVSYNYTVTQFDPNVLNDSPTIAATSTPPTAGAAYTFNSIAQARIDEELRPVEGLDWISALRFSQISTLVESSNIQMELPAASIIYTELVGAWTCRRASGREHPHRSAQEL
jgi:hypothetical protein